MAQPQARSYNAILGDMVAGFLARKRVPKLKAASPILSILEAAAQSDLRSTQDVFAALNSVSLERSAGQTLDRIGAGEGIGRRNQRAATGLITFSDTSFTKASGRLSAAKPAPAAGSTVIYLSDATGWPATGSVYLGRGGDNYEGPVAYTSLVDSGSFWTMTLATGTTRFHQQNESVVRAQGGNRQIPAGTQVATTRGLTSTPVTFSTVYPATIVDGETYVEGVYVVCSTPGTVGNVAAGGVSTVTSSPFVGAAVSNPSAFISGRDAETDNDYRDRITKVRSSRSRGTDLAIQTAATGVSSDEDSKRVVSASIVRRENRPTTLYIDDGTGFEETDSPVAIEPLMDSGLGGEEFFQLSLRPVAKAYVATEKTSPFSLTTDSHLVVAVAGVEYDHYFDVQGFRNITSATAYEVVASINGNPLLPFSARTVNGGTGVAIFSKGDTNEDIQVKSATTGDDANEALAFGTTRVETVSLYKNDLLLSKDGLEASLVSASKGSWDSFGTSETLIISVDGTPAVTYTFNAASFLNANTGYVTFGHNSIAAWVKVLNYTIPGITAIAVGQAIQITSNSDRSARASIAISGGGLVDKGVWEAVTVTGRDSDYTMNRNTGEIRLSTPLVAGDSLSAGSFNTRAFLQSASLTTVTTAATANFWFAVDGDASRVTTGVDTVTPYGLTNPTTGTWGERWHLTASAGTPFANAQSGDWLVIWDTAVNVGLRGVWRVAAVLSSGQTLAFDSPVTGIADVASFTFANANLRVVRSSRQPQNIQVSAGTYTASSLATTINSQIIGATASTYRTTRVRVKTNSFGLEGDIGLVAQDSVAATFGLSETTASTQNLVGHLASVVAGNTEVGTTDFVYRTARDESTTSTNLFGHQTALIGRAWNKMAVGERNRNSVSTTARWGNNSDFHSPISSVVIGGSNTALTTRIATEHFWAASDSFYLAQPYSIGPNDTLTTIIDGDTSNKRFVTQMYRRVTPTSSSYASSNVFVDADNSGQSLTAAFGLGYSFNDFAAYMRSRLLTHSADATKRILWRWKRYGADGDNARLRYAYPLSASAALAVSVDNQPTNSLTPYNAVTVRLPSGAARTDATFLPRESTAIGYGVQAIGRNAITICCGFPVATASRTTTVVTLTLSLTMGLYNLTDHGITVGSVIHLASSSGSFSSGAKVVTGVTLTTVSYAEAGTAAGPIASIGNISTDSVERRLNTGSVAVGDVIRLADVAAIPVGWRGRSIRINSLGDRYIQGYADSDSAIGFLSTTLTYSQLVSGSNLSIFPINSGSATATAIAAAVNALATSPVTATVTGTGLGTVLLSSQDEAATANVLVEYAALSDGVNWVQTTTSPGSLAGNYTLAFKAPISAGLATNSDWLNEDIRLAPITAAGVNRWLNTLGVSGLSQAADVSLANNGRAPQIVSATPGTQGSVQVQGGTANSASASIVGNLTTTGSGVTGATTYGYFSISADQAAGFTAGTTVSVANSQIAPIPGIVSSSTVLSADSADGSLTLTSAALYTVTQSYTPATDIQVKRQGRYLMIGNLDFGTTLPKIIHLNATGASPISSANAGAFRPIAIHADDAFLTQGAAWLEHDNGVEEEGKTADIIEVKGLMPGDYLAISGDEWGAANQGVWRIESVGVSGGVAYSDTTKIKLDVSQRAWVPVGSAVALGSAAPKFQFYSGVVGKVVGPIHSISPNPTDASLVDLRLDLAPEYTTSIPQMSVIPEVQIADSHGAVVVALDKLAFPTSIVPGSDGYRYNTGLLGEVSRVVIGDPRDPASYPGVAAAGSNINISGPLVKRIQVSLAIRLRLGVLPQSAISYVRSAVAAAVNNFGVGKSVVISNLVGAAASVNGVASVSIVSPTYNSENDVISVQPYEKPLVLNAEQDISVSIIGE